MENISEKIRKLLALAANNTNPNEAALAAARAQELMTKYAIEEDSLKGDPLHVKEPIAVENLNMGYKRIPHWELRLGMALQRSFFCKIWYSPGHDGFVCGRTSDRLAFKATFEYLRAEIKRMAEVAWQKEQNDAVHGKRWKNGYYEGCCSTISSRLVDAMRLLNADNAGTAMVLANRNDEIIKWVEENQRLRHNSGGHRSFNPSGFRQGAADGHALNLGKRAGANRQLGA